MQVEEFIKELEGNSNLREEFFYNPEIVSKRYDIKITQEQLQKFTLARELEKDPLLRACMCPITIGTTDKKEDFIRYEKKDLIAAK